MLIPKRTKYRKLQKIPITNTPTRRSNTLIFGTYGLQATSYGRITARQIEACRKVIRRRIKGIGILYIRVFPHYPVTKKPIDIRIGRGKGDIDHWICRIRTNRVLFELKGVSHDQAKVIFKLASAKLSLSTKIISKN